MLQRSSQLRASAKKTIYKTIKFKPESIKKAKI
jgi:hypothetical protein